MAAEHAPREEHRGSLWRRGDDPHPAAELRQEVERLRLELARTRAWCASLEQQQAQLAAVLLLIAGPARVGLTRFPVGALLDELVVEGQ